MISYLQYESGINLILQNVSGTITTKGVFGCALVGRTKSFFFNFEKEVIPRPLHRRDAYGHFIKTSSTETNSLVCKVQLTEGAKMKKTR